jgi:hypothetical protein
LPICVFIQHAYVWLRKKKIKKRLTTWLLPAARTHSRRLISPSSYVIGLTTMSNWLWRKIIYHTINIDFAHVKMHENEKWKEYIINLINFPWNFIKLNISFKQSMLNTKHTFLFNFQRPLWQTDNKLHLSLDYIM